MEEGGGDDMIARTKSHVIGDGDHVEKSQNGCMLCCINILAEVISDY